MLILTRLPNETIVIFREGDNADQAITVTIADVKGDKVKLGFTAPPSVKILRKELLDSMKDQSKRRGDHER